ncbi:MAG: c-type cytochrome [Candidatus Binatia bacterium]
MERRHSRIAALAAIGLFGFLGGLASAADDPGIKVFVEKRCYTCHAVSARPEVDKAQAAFLKASGAEPEEEGGDKDTKGGDLSDVGKKHDAAWLQEFLKNPKPHFNDSADCQRQAKQKDRKKFKGTPEDLTALTGFLTSLKSEAKQAPGFTSCLK